MRILSLLAIFASLALVACDTAGFEPHPTPDGVKSVQVEESLAIVKHAELSTFLESSNMLNDALEQALADSLGSTSAAKEVLISARLSSAGSPTSLTTAPTVADAVVRLGPDLLQINLQVHISITGRASTPTVDLQFVASFTEQDGEIISVELTSFARWQSTSRFTLVFLDADGNQVELNNELDYINVIGRRAGLQYAEDYSSVRLMEGEIYKFRAQGGFGTGYAQYKGEYEIPADCNGCIIELRAPERQLTRVLFPATLAAEHLPTDRDHEVRIEAEMALVDGSYVVAPGADYVLNPATADQFNLSMSFPSEGEFEGLDFWVDDVSGQNSEDIRFGGFEIEPSALECEIVVDNSPEYSFYDGSYRLCVHEDVQNLDVAPPGVKWGGVNHHR